MKVLDKLLNIVKIEYNKEYDELTNKEQKVDIGEKYIHNLYRLLMFIYSKKDVKDNEHALHYSSYKDEITFLSEIVDDLYRIYQSGKISKSTMDLIERLSDNYNNNLDINSILLLEESLIAGEFTFIAEEVFYNWCSMDVEILKPIINLMLEGTTVEEKYKYLEILHLEIGGRLHRFNPKILTLFLEQEYVSNITLQERCNLIVNNKSIFEGKHDEILNIIGLFHNVTSKQN